MLVLRWTWYAGAWFIIKMLSYQYRKSHCGDETIVISSYLHNGISYTGKMTSLYWIRAQVFVCTVLSFSGTILAHSHKQKLAFRDLVQHVYYCSSEYIYTSHIRSLNTQKPRFRVILVRISSLVICAALCKITVSSLLKYWKYCSLALNLRYMFIARSPLAVHAIFAAANGLVPNSDRPTTAIILPNQPFFPNWTHRCKMPSWHPPIHHRIVLISFWYQMAPCPLPTKSVLTIRWGSISSMVPLGQNKQVFFLNQQRIPILVCW